MTAPITGNCTVSISGRQQTPSTTTTTHSGSVYATLINASAGCTFDTSQSGATTPPVNSNMSFPHGGYKWRLVGCSPGETVRVSLTFPSLAGMTLMKYGPYPTPTSPSRWYAPNNLVINGNNATFDVVDNGVGDSDNASGVILDPAFPVPDTSGSTGIPTLTEWGQLFLGSLLALGGVAFIRRRRMST